MVVRRAQRAKVEHRLVRAVGHVAEALRRQVIFGGNVATIFGILGNEQVGLAQPAALQLEDEAAGGAVGGGQPALLGHQV